MNLATLTPDQRRSVMRVSGPLLISAGAGSGKTFTLTQRIAYALSTATGSDVSDINEVLAITFTDKAAGEIKERVKSTLRLEGLHEQAMKVDAAWISTIHSMCSRILRAHALEIGIDPGFGVIADTIKNELVAEAIDEALGTDNDILSKTSYPQLFEEFRPSQVSDMLGAVLSRASNLKHGLDDIDAGPHTRKAKEIAKDLLLAYEQLLPNLEQAGTAKSAEIARERSNEAIQDLQAFLFADENAASIEALAALMNKLHFVPKTFGSADVKTKIADYQRKHAEAANEVVIALAQPCFIELMDLAKDVLSLYEAKKAELLVFDNDDLLTKTLKAFEEHPEIAEKYSQQFKLVMVDEFQDTSQVQIEIINHLAGENSKNLCTVGDYQQSIYRFRGADVNVYEAHKKEMKSDVVKAMAVELSKNFRSHQDVLSFVERVFSQDQVFGEKFMELSHDENRPSEFKLGAPRIDLVLAMSPAGNNTGVSKQDLKMVEAQAIAKRFAVFREAGHDPGDMVVLLGKMTNAQTYAQALRNEGFECVIAGGSLFHKAPEVHVIARLAQVLANGLNSAALFEVLSSELFCLSSDDFLELSTWINPDTNKMSRRDLSKGFTSLIDRFEQGENLSPGLGHAACVMRKAWSAISTGSLSSVIEDVLKDSGYLTRLQSEGAVGIAVAGNLFKALRIIEGLEKERSFGPSQVANEFSIMLEAGLKEAPGALTGTSEGVVKIMTIHASKGLEFPLVAVAEFYGLNNRTSKLVIETCDNKTFSSLSLGSAVDAYPELCKRSEQYRSFAEEDELQSAQQFTEAENAAVFRKGLLSFAAREELAEARRKFYVGLTRASEALVVAFSAHTAIKNPLSVYKDIVDDIRTALCGNQDFPHEIAALDYGGTRAASFERILVSPSVVPSFSVEEKLTETKRFDIPVVQAQNDIQDSASISLAREGVFSYSSLASAKESEKSEEAQVPRTKAGAKKPPSDADKATDLGSAFHRLAQYAIETNSVPDKERVHAITSSYNLSSKQAKRLSAAQKLWFESEEFARTQVYSTRIAELPFIIALDDLWLEGEIDLFCTHADRKKALVIDYKTGGSSTEDEAALIKKHQLQASCYAYAILKQGFDEVELRFVRVEVEDQNHPGEPQVVAYTFTSKETRALRRMILDLYLRSRS